jgi:hypothetical protein
LHFLWTEANVGDIMASPADEGLWLSFSWGQSNLEDGEGQGTRPGEEPLGFD